MSVRVIHGDCVEVMRSMDEASVDAIVTDPPYDLLTTSRNGSRRINNPDTPAGRAARGFMGKTWDGTGIAFRSVTWAEALRVIRPGGYLLSFGGPRTFHRLTVAIEDAGFEVRDCLMWLYGSGFPKSLNLHGEREGWGTALKPAWEPIILARKPLMGTVAQNVEKYGTGALNIERTRIPASDNKTFAERVPDGRSNYRMGSANGSVPTDVGRWPANVLLDEEAAAMLDEQAGNVPGQQGRAKDDGSPQNNKIYGALRHGTLQPEPRGDRGGPSRFFYVAKASKKDRGEGNSHPTVKPVALMRYLVKIVTPPGGLVLDPFAGSGTTGLAAEAEGFRSVLIEREAEYVQIIRSRLPEAGVEARESAPVVVAQIMPAPEACSGCARDDCRCGGIAL